MPSHDPSRKRGSWRVLGRVQRPDAAERAAKRAASRHKAAKEVSDFDLSTLVQLSPFDESCGSITNKLEKMAATLWTSDLAPLIATERSKLAELGLISKTIELKAAAPPSSYTARGLTKNVERKNEKTVGQASDMAATALRQANQQVFPVSICARSIAMLLHRVHSKDWLDLLLNREVLSRPTTIKLVHLMMACRPAPKFLQHPSCIIHIFDHTYRKKGESRGRHRATQQVEARGDHEITLSTNQAQI